MYGWGGGGGRERGNTVNSICLNLKSADVIVACVPAGLNPNCTTYDYMHAVILCCNSLAWIRLRDPEKISNNEHEFSHSLNFLSVGQRSALVTLYYGVNITIEELRLIWPFKRYIAKRAERERGVYSLQGDSEINVTTEQPHCGDKLHMQKLLFLSWSSCAWNNLPNDIVDAGIRVTP